VGKGLIAPFSAPVAGSGGAAITNGRIRDGRRLNIPSSYLYPVMDQANLIVLTAAYVNRLTIESNTVTGVEFEWQNEVRRIKASSEVVLSAGAIQTPKTLMLSGIGDRAELDRFGIATCRTCRASAGTSRIIRSSVADYGKPLGPPHAQQRLRGQPLRKEPSGTQHA
jgi:choline dehydrogenase-like flavoprotein